MRFFFLAIFSGLFSVLNAQFTEPKFGNIEISDLSMTKYDKDTTADALILFDNGLSRFVLNSSREFQFVYERHFRIKIFKKSAFHFADVAFKLYRKNSTEEKLSGLKAVTYNLENGKVVEKKVGNKDVFLTEGENYIIKKFAFPDVKEGSIIELSYSITSDLLYNFRGWNFQYSCPALWSQYSWIIPEYFTYNLVSKGYLQFDVSNRRNGVQIFKIHQSGESTGGRMGTERTAPEDISIKAITTESVLAIKDVPRFVSEPNIDCEDNYIQSIEFELNAIQYPGQDRKEYTETWESVNDRMNSDRDFGMLFNADGFIKDTVQAICKNKSSEIEKARSIYEYVQRKMKWDDSYSLWSLRGLKKPYAEQTGNSSEINLLLLIMLRNAGIKADPVIFSTRDNGFQISNSPTVSKFNSVLVKAEVDGKIVLMDAISKYCPFGILPANDLNGKGRVVNNATGDWVDLKTDSKYQETKNYVLAISEDGLLKGTITGNYQGYAGIWYHNDLTSEKNNDDYVRNLQENSKGLTVNSYSIRERDNSNPVYDTFNVEIADHTELIGDKILFNPLLFERLERNRYTLEERKYPVDYNYPISEAYNFEYTIPSGYKVESLPKPAFIKMPDNSISMSYQITCTDNKIKVEYKRDVNKILFLPAEYKTLKDLYDQIVKKHAEQIILTRSI